MFADTYTLTDQHGNEIVFFGFDIDAAPAEGQLWKMTDNAGNCAFVGDATTAADAITNGFDGDGRIELAYDPADRRYTYTYTTLNGTERLTEVKAETKTGGTWASPTGVTEVASVNYEYYGDEDHGDIGDLKLVEVTTPLTDSGVELIRKKYYRYWEGETDGVSDFDSSTNPGYVHALKLVLDFEGTRNYDYTGDSTFDEDFLTESDANLEPYAAAYLEYDSSHRVDLAWFQGECGCSGGNDGTHEYEYETNGSYSDDAGYDEEWASRTIVKLPDDSYHTQYFDEAHQPIHFVITDDDPDNTNPAPSTWATRVIRNTSGGGCVRAIYTPANVTAYTHSTGAFSVSSNDGLIVGYCRVTSGEMKHFLESRTFKEGNGGDNYLDGFWTYSRGSVTPTNADANVDRPYIASVREYTQRITSGTTGSNLWSYATSFHSGTLAIEKVETTAPTVSTGNNGSNSAVVTKTYSNPDGTLAFGLSGTGIVTYHESTNGQRTKLIRDADTTQTGSGEDFENVTIPTGFGSSGSPLHAKTTWTYDPQGRNATSTEPDGKIVSRYYSNLADERMVTISYPKSDATPKWWGPAQASVTNHAGRAEATMTIAISGGSTTTALTGHVDESDADPIVAMDLGTVAALSTNLHSEGGTTLEESRLYFDVPASGAGSDGTNYDPTFHGTDERGRRTRLKEAHGTITRTVYDLRGNVTARWIGTNDASFPDGESSGTDNMVKVEELEYDGGSDGGNGLLTEETVHLDDSGTSTRVTSYAYDVKGNLLLQTNPTAPHMLHKVDNLNRRIATALYGGVGNITVGTTDPTATGTATDRLALTTSSFDERGDLWKSVRYEIDVADGSDDDTLETLHWYDADRRRIKTDGSQLTKTIHDRLGRATHTFLLANDNDSGYADADDVSGDIVLQESQRIYDETAGDLLLTARIDRKHDDTTTTGALDSNADGDAEKLTAANISGRVFAEAHDYDVLGRRSESVVEGTNGGSDLNYNALSWPASRAGTEQVHTYAFSDAGRIEEVMDPLGNTQRTEHDDAGRVVKEIRNYDSGVNSGNPSGTDDNVTVLYQYTDGLMTKLTADVTGTDQETLYIYGTTNGTPSASEITTGHLLRAIVYPDSTNTGTDEGDINTDDSDVVSFAYNAQGEQVEKIDQAGNVFVTEFDASGRTTNLKWTNAISGFDDDVLRIARTYDSLGRPRLVTQYDAATSGSVVDEARYTYDDWSNIAAFDYDRDSAVDAGGSDDEYSISYVWAKNTGGRNTLRKTQATFPSGNVITYTYSSSSSLDDDASRVTEVKDGAVSLAKYEYLGTGTVVGTVYDEPGVFYRLYTSSSTYSTRMDDHNRITACIWTKDLATDRDFYSTSIAWDDNGNVTSIEDNVHEGFDVKYSIDDIDRVTRADEGTLISGSITSRTRDQQWTLDHVGNWSRKKLDLDGDGNFTDPDELDEVRTHNEVNELEARDIDDDSSDDFNLTYDAVGNLTDDGEDYEYVYDGFGRLRKILDESDQSLIAEYRYNGLGHLTAVHEDTDDDDDVDGDDKWFYRMYDERWRWIGTFREDDSDPKEEFIPHQAGADGDGGSSYIDLVILRDRDGDNDDWTTAADGTMEERIYYCQNWRADVSAIVDASGAMVEWVKYSAYGVPFGLPRGDTDSNGTTDATDRTNISGWSSGYDVRYDVNLDETIDATDEALASNVSMGIHIGSHSKSLRCFAGHSSRSVPGAATSRYRNLNTSLESATFSAPFGCLEGDPGSLEFEITDLDGGVDPLTDEIQ